MQKRFFIFVIFSLPLAFSCHKIIEKKKENLAIDAITDGHWYVKEYKAAGLFVTAEFNGYEFQFYKDGKVDAILNTAITPGTWVGDIDHSTITSIFAGAPQPVSRLNGLWNITDNSFTDVKAYNLSGSDTNYLELQKK